MKNQVENRIDPLQKVNKEPRVVRIGDFSISRGLDISLSRRQKKLTKHFHKIKRAIKKTLSLNNNSSFIKKATAFLMILLILGGVYFMSSDKTQGATYTYNQTNWSGGLSGGTYPIHPTNQTSWTKYDSKDTNTSIVNSGADLQLAATSSSITLDTDTDFSTGTHSQSAVSGTGTGAVVEVGRETATATMAIATGSGFACALDEYGYVYCWGDNSGGVIGDGTTGTTRITPTRVVKGDAVSGDYANISGTDYLSNIRTIRAGGGHICAISNQDIIYCWGFGNYGQLGNGSGSSSNIPVRVIKGAAVTGDYDGTNHMVNVADVSLATYTTCLFSKAGHAYCWGLNGDGEFGNGASGTNDVNPTRVKAGAALSGDYVNDGGTNYLYNIRSLKLGLDKSACAITNADNIYCWGKNEYGAVGDNSTTMRTTPVRVEDGAATGDDTDGTYLKNISGISIGGDNHVCVFSVLGFTYCWGNNTDGQLGDNTTTESHVPVKALKGEALSGDNDGTYLTNIKDIDSISPYTTCAVSNNGIPYCWGENSYLGRLGDGTSSEYHTPVRIAKGGALAADYDGTDHMINIKDIGAAAGYGCALSNAGNVYCWGDNNYGQLGNNTTTYTGTNGPVRTHGVSDSGYLSLITPHYSSGTFTQVVDIGRASNFSTLSFSKTTPSNTTLTVDARAGNTATPDGTWTSWQTDISSGGSISGLNGNRYVEYRVNMAISSGTETPSLDSLTINYSNYQNPDSYSITHTSDTDFGAGSNTDTEVTGSGSDGSVGLTREVGVSEAMVSAGKNSACSVSEYGEVYCWGHNGNGRLGDGTTNSSSVPVRVLKGEATGDDSDGTYLKNIKSISGSNSRCAVSNAGNAYCWGSYPTGSENHTPVKVLKGEAVSGDNDGTYLTNVVSIAAGQSSYCAITGSGNAYCWGYNYYGQLGNNSTTQVVTPVRVLKGSAITEDNDGTYLINMRSIDVWEEYQIANVCAVSNSNNIYCWGYNPYGEIGNNSTTEMHVPTRVSKGGALEADNDGTYLDNIENVSVGAKNVCAAAVSGNAYCWGYNASGQLGNNSTTQSLVPVSVLKGNAIAGDNDGTYLTNIKDISAKSWSNGYAVSNSNQIYAWGDGDSIGDNNTSNDLTPVIPVKGDAVSADNDGTYLTNIKSATGGGEYAWACAVSHSSNAYCWGNNTYGQIGNNGSGDPLYPVRVHGVSNSGYLNLGVDYNASGTFTNIIDTGQVSNFTTLSFTATTPSGTGVTIDARSGDTATPDGTWTSWKTGIESGGTIRELSNHRYIQYRANLTTTEGQSTPTLDSLTVNYKVYTTTQTLTSSAYNTADATNAMAKIVWTENLPSGTDVKFQIRTAPNNGGVPGTWTDFMGIDGTSSSYLTDNTGGEGMPSALYSGGNDQWFQYKVFLISDGASTPTVSDITATYVVNAPPAFDSSFGTNGVSVTQISNSVDANWGKVQIQYAIKDQDATTGTFSPNYVTPTFEYTLNGGTNWNTVTEGNLTYASAPSGGGYSTYNGHVTNKVLEGSFLTYTAYWDAKTQIPATYSASFKIRITIDDNESANHTAIATGNTTSVDTKNPSGLSLSINHTTSTLTMGTPVDDSSYQMVVSNLSNFADGTYETFASPYSYTNPDSSSKLTDDPATVYLRIRDAYGNYTDVSSTTPAKPDNMTWYDLSDTANEVYREFIAWDVISPLQVGSGFSHYRVYRSVDDGPYVSVSTIADREISYYLDDNVSAGTHYYYKVVTEDTNGDVSVFSTIKDDIPDGQGGSDSTPPTIFGVNVSSIETTSATVSWTTDEVSNSSVGYSIDTQYLPEIGTVAMGTSHSITLTGLTPGTSYNVRVKSRDAEGNLAQNDKDNPGSTPIGNFTFETLPGPAISLVNVPEIANTQATITWDTTTDSSTYVVYTDELDEDGLMVDPISIGTPDLVGGSSPYHHSQTLTDLIPNTTYYFYVKSIDDSDNVAIDNNGGNFYELLTTQDNLPPVISSVETSIVNDTSAAIHWVTDEQATSQVRYATTSGGPYTSTTKEVLLSRSHYVILNGLTSNTTYYYKVASEDINGNETVSAEYEFTTQVNPEFDHDPLSEITDITESIITDEKAVVSFKTDQLAQCSVEYGTQAGSYSEVPMIETTYNESHAIHLTGLIFSTPYYYQITCLDNLNTSVSSDEKTFTTLPEQVDATSGDGSGGPDTTAPSISGINVSKATGESVTITWDTDEKANSLVTYGITKEYESMAGDKLVNLDSVNYDTVHAVTITNLTPATKYYFAVVSTDASGNISESAQDTFTTKSPSSLSSINIESKSLNEVTVTWKTSVKASSLIEYGLTESYGDKKESTTLTQEHEMTLNNLESNTLYHFRVKGKDSDNNWYSSGDYTLEPKSPPSITNIKLADVTENGVKVTFETNVPTDALLTYTASDETKSGSQGKPDLAVTHEISLQNLASGTDFALVIKVRDENGNEAESQPQAFTTGKDETNPVIDQIKTDSALAQNDKVQTIITWTTNEPTNATLIYREGRNGEEKELTVDQNYSNYHIAVLTAFKPGTVYYFKVESSDRAGNTTISEDYALLTPRRKENIIQIIVANFEDIFGWAKMK